MTPAEEYALARANGGICICPRSNSTLHGPCGPACRGGQGMCWQCRFLRHCHLPSTRTPITEGT